MIEVSVIFSIHHIVRGHIAARSGDEVLRLLGVQLKGENIEHAATGLAGAWLRNQFAGFRRVVFYVPKMPSPKAQRVMEPKLYVACLRSCDGANYH